MTELKALQRERLEQYLAAERAVLCGQSYTIGDRTLTRADLGKIQSAINDLLAELSAVELKNGRTRRVVFVE